MTKEQFNYLEIEFLKKKVKEQAHLIEKLEKQNKEQLLIQEIEFLEKRVKEQAHYIYKLEKERKEKKWKNY